jgi:methylase of polypeptide subunit release factors
MARTLTRSRRPTALPSRRFRSEDEAWNAFIAGAREALADSGAAGEVSDEGVHGLAAALRARFEGPAGGTARANGKGARGRIEAWLSAWRFVPSDAEADPLARALGPEAMARVHEEVSGADGSVYTEPGEVRFMARRALAEHLCAAFPEAPALPREKAFRLAGATDRTLARAASRLSAAERRAAAERLRSLRAIDPACGAGAFLLGLVEEIARLGGALGMGDAATLRARAVSQSVSGLDVDAAALDIARLRLERAAPGARPRLIAADALLDEASAGAPPRGFDLVIGNPPYVRQERIGRHSGLGAGAKRALETAARERWGRRLGLSGRADLYVYFFLEGLRLLRPGGTLVFLTSHAWLDLDYGAALRAFLLEEADIRLVLEPDARAFRRASVNVAITVASRRAPGTREGLPVRFAALRRPLRRAAEGPLFTALGGSREIDDAALRIRIAAAGDLAPPRPGIPAPAWGATWLRAPAVILRAREASAGRTVPLGDLAEVVFGLKTGCNDFFYLEDDGPAPHGKGAGGNQSRGVRLCRSRLTGERHPIESRFLEPVVTTLKEIDGLEVAPTRLRRRVLSIPPNADLAGTFVAAYVRIGEARGVHRIVSVASRRPWYALAPPRAALLLPRRIGQRMPIARSRGAAFDNNLFGITPRRGVPLSALQAALNATLTRIHVELHARELTGAQAVADTNVYLVKGLPVPRADLLRAGAGELARALETLAARRAGSIFEETGRADRDALDALVLSLWGLSAREIGPVQEALKALVRRRLARAEGREKPPPRKKPVERNTLLFSGLRNFLHKGTHVQKNSGHSGPTAL